MDRQKSTSHCKTHRDCVIDSISKIASASNVQLSEATMAIYAERLVKLTAHQIGRGTTRTIDVWTEPSKMPPLAFILERSYHQITMEVPDDAPRILSRPALPGHVENRNERADFAAQVIAEMRAKLEAGANATPSAEMPHDPE